LEQQGSIIQSSIVPEPGVFSAYGHAWNKMWKYFLELLLVAIVGFALGIPAGIFSWVTDFGPAASFFGLLSFVYSILIGGPVSFGIAYVYLKAARGQKVEIQDMFESFKNYWNTVLAIILTYAIIVVGFIMLIIPGIIFACKLTFVPYLVVDRKMEVIDAIKESWNMTNGHSLSVFAIGLLGIPICIAGLILFGVGIILSYMWIYLTLASLYYAVSSLKQRTV
jgi:uncharacterized membrane protein